jgi:hypothetical protein
VGPNSQHVTAADFNGDGILDLAVSDFGNYNDNSGGNVRIFLGKSDGSLTAGAVISSVITPVALHAGDFNGDGKSDLAVADVNDNLIAVLPGNGDGTFQAPVKLTASGTPSSLIALDFNGDGKLDIAAANYSAASPSSSATATERSSPKPPTRAAAAAHDTSVPPT